MSSSDSMSGSTIEAAPSTVGDEVTQETEKKADKGRKTRKKKRAVTFDEAFASRFMHAESILSTKNGLALAQFVLETRSDSIPFLLSKLSQTGTRKKLENLDEALSKLEGTDGMTAGVILSSMFCEDKNMSGLIYKILNIVAPERDFGKSTGDNLKDAIAIANKWGDGVNLSILKQLIV